MKRETIQKLLNPVRIKIVNILIREKEMTRKQIQEHIPSVPQATLYRHIKTLMDCNVLKVVNEEQIRGTIERTYALAYNPFERMNEIGVNANRDQLLDVFATYAFTLMNDFSEYLSEEQIDLVKDYVGFRSIPMYLNEKENIDCIEEFKNLLIKYGNFEDDGNRSLRKFSYVFMPKKEGKEE